MRIVIDRTHCELCQSYCDRHVAKLVRFPMGEDRPCIQAMEDDGQTTLTLLVRDGPTVTTLALTPEEQAIIAVEGLSNFLPDQNGGQV